MMNLMLYDPFVGRRRRTDLFGRLFGSSLPIRFDEDDKIFIPKVDITEEDEAYLVKAELPGFPKEEVKVDVEEGVLHLRAEHKEEKEEKKDNYHLRERRFGSFSRSFRLPDHVAADKVEASMENGVLTVKLPKTEEAAPRRIDVQVH